MKIRAFLLAASLLAAPPAGAEIGITYATQGMTLFGFTAPDGWTVNGGTEVAGVEAMPRVVSLLPPDSTQPLWVGLWSPLQVATLADAPAWLADLNLDLLEEPEVTATTERRVNGLPARVIEGTGRREGLAMNFAIALVQVAPARIAVAATIGTPEARAMHEAELGAILNSIMAEGAR